jgi:hypothetical protein
MDVLYHETGYYCVRIGEITRFHVLLTQAAGNATNPLIVPWTDRLNVFCTMPIIQNKFTKVGVILPPNPSYELCLRVAQYYTDMWEMHPDLHHVASRFVKKHDLQSMLVRAWRGFKARRFARRLRQAIRKHHAMLELAYLPSIGVLYHEAMRDWQKCTR